MEWPRLSRSHDDRDATALLAKNTGGLAGRVGSADDVDVSSWHACPSVVAPVVDAASVKASMPAAGRRRYATPVVTTRLWLRATAVTRPTTRAGSAHGEAGHSEGDQHLRPEISACVVAAMQSPPRMPEESEVVLDLELWPAWPPIALLRPARFQLPRRRRRGPQTGGASTDHDEVVEGRDGVLESPRAAGDLGRGGSLQGLACFGDDEWQIARSALGRGAGLAPRRPGRARST